MINPSVASVKYQPVSINHATNLNLKVRTTSANSVRTKREQRTNNARTAYEQRANYARTAYANSYEQRANYARTTRELRARTHPRTTRRAPLAKGETLTKSNPTSPRDGWYRAPIVVGKYGKGLCSLLSAISFGAYSEFNFWKRPARHSVPAI